MDAQLQLKSQRLQAILGGCLSNSSIHDSERQLMQASNDPSFVSQLCLLIPNSDKNMKSLICTTLKNFMLARYNANDNPIPFDQKELLKQHLFKIFYQLYPEPAPVKVYKEIMHVMILVDFPWQGITQLLHQDLDSDIVAAVYFLRQVAKANEYLTQADQRKNFDQVISEYFPRLEQVVPKIFLNFNEQTSDLLHEAFKTLYSAFHIEIPAYLRNFDNLDRWISFAETVLNVPSDPLALKNQEIAARIYLKLFALYANDGQDGKQFAGWAAEFRSRYCQRLFQHVVNLIGERKGNAEIMSTLLYCLYEVVKKEYLRVLFTSRHCEVLLYENCLLPLCQSSPAELALFKDDPVEYVNREEDLTCEPLRRSVLDLVSIVADVLSFNGKSEMIRLVEYAASVLQGPSEGEKEVIVRVLTKIGRQILKNKYLKGQFQNLTVQFFIPLLLDQSPLLNSLACELLSLYLPFGELDDQTVSRLMEIIYEKIVNNGYLVIRYNAILAFTALLNHRAALEAAAPHFSKILEIYVGMLNSFEHENLLGCLESIVRHFSAEVVVFAPQLIAHLAQLFLSLCRTGEQQDDEEEPDGNSPATAALSTISQLLSCQLSPDVYRQVSFDLTSLLRGIFGPHAAYFDAILSLFNVLVHRAKDIADFNYPYVACRILLEGDYSLLNSAGLPEEVAQELRAAEKADSEFEDDLLSILKNLIQKMPPELLKRYSYPSHPQLILCLIENQRFALEEVCNLNIGGFDQNWAPYI